MKSILSAEISNVSVKKEALTYFFDLIGNYYEYRYIMLKTIEDLQRNEKNIEYVIPHIKGDPYFLMIGTIGRKNFGYLIDKRKLKYNLDQCNVNEIKIYNYPIKIVPKAYLGSLFDGRIINNGEIQLYLIQDSYYLEGIKMNAWKLEKKMNYLDEYVSKNIKNTNIKIRKVDPISEIATLDKKISKSSVDINGFIFMQARSGISYIFIDNENFKNKSTEQTLSLEEKLDNQFVPEKIESTDENVYLIKKDAKPDVYHVYDKNNNLLHFASIPDAHTSQLVFNVLSNKDFAYFKCEMDERWKRFKPVALIES